MWVNTISHIKYTHITFLFFSSLRLLTNGRGSYYVAMIYILIISWQIDTNFFYCYLVSTIGKKILIMYNFSIKNIISLILILCIKVVLEIQCPIFLSYLTINTHTKILTGYFRGSLFFPYPFLSCELDFSPTPLPSLLFLAPSLTLFQQRTWFSEHEARLTHFFLACFLHTQKNYTHRDT